MFGDAVRAGHEVGRRIEEIPADLRDKVQALIGAASTAHHIVAGDGVQTRAMLARAVEEEREACERVAMARTASPCRCGHAIADAIRARGKPEGQVEGQAEGEALDFIMGRPGVLEEAIAEARRLVTPVPGAPGGTSVMLARAVVHLARAAEEEREA